MLTTGLPHGATDHLVFQKNTKGLSGKKFWVHFLGRYLLLMAVYAAFWMILPVISLLVFLLMSFFHFGQSEFFYIQSTEKHPLKITLYLSWGALILLSILHFNFSESIALIGEVVSDTNSLILFWESFGNLTLGGLAGITFGCFLYFFLKGALKQQDLFIEAAIIGLFLFLFYHANLLLSFVIYFGLWHASKAIYFEMKTLGSENKLGLKKFIQEAIPFTLLSVLGIVMLILASEWFSGLLSPLMLFFIVISVLTLPHMTFMAVLYQKEG